MRSFTAVKEWQVKKWLGVEVVEVFDWYDRPILFSGKVDGDTCLFVLNAENDVRERWLSVRLSPERYEQVRRGDVDLHDAYKLAEDGRVNVLLVPFAAATQGMGFAFPCDRLTQDMLPMAGMRLALDNADGAENGGG